MLHVGGTRGVSLHVVLIHIIQRQAWITWGGEKKKKTICFIVLLLDGGRESRIKTHDVFQCGIQESTPTAPPAVPVRVPPTTEKSCMCTT